MVGPSGMIALELWLDSECATGDASAPGVRHDRGLDGGLPLEAAIEAFAREAAADRPQQAVDRLEEERPAGCRGW